MLFDLPLFSLHQISTIKRDHNGKYKRVVITLAPTRLSLIELQKIQKKFALLIPGVELLPVETLHLTLFHFGKPQELYSDLKNYTKISYKSFLESFIKMLNDLSYIKNNLSLILKAVDYSLSADDYFIFDNATNSKTKVIGIKFTKTAFLKNLRKPYLLIFVSWLCSLGINKNDIKKLLEDSVNLKFISADTYTPHVSLGTVANTTSKLHLSFSPIDITFGNFEITNII